MPLTVITVKNASNSLRGDLSKWMQEIATGVYVGNFNCSVRKELWDRVKDSIGSGEATISFYHRNEIGYDFDTINSRREVYYCEGIPLVLLPKEGMEENTSNSLGYSDASKFRKAKKYSATSNVNIAKPFIVLDIETDGLDECENSIIEIAAIKVCETENQEFNYLIRHDTALPQKISDLTGITDSLLQNEGWPLSYVLNDFLDFIGSCDIVGYKTEFDIKFLNNQLKKTGLPLIKNKRYDLMRYVKKERRTLSNYALEAALKSYGINAKVPHRALGDARLILKLLMKLKFFQDKNNRSVDL